MRERGFSLLELLVVLFIAGLLTSLAVAWLDGEQCAARQALARLAAAARSQAGLAVHAGQVQGLRWTGERPEFVRQVEGDSQPAWQVEPVALGDWPRELRPDWPASDEPRLVVSATGLVRSDALRWSWPGGVEVWRWDAQGRLQRTLQP